MKTIFYSIILCLIMGCSPSLTPEMAKQHVKEINLVMDDWHNAAGEADFDRYFDHFADENSIFMGTDATERWDIAEFKAYSKPHFDRGRAWNFTPVVRHVYISEEGKTAWFDEELDTPNLGPSRGTGTLVFKEGEWKLAHYNLTVPIPNVIMNDVKTQIEQALSQ